MPKGPPFKKHTVLKGMKSCIQPILVFNGYKKMHHSSILEASHMLCHFTNVMESFAAVLLFSLLLG